MRMHLVRSLIGTGHPEIGSEGGAWVGFILWEGVSLWIWVEMDCMYRVLVPLESRGSATAAQGGSVLHVERAAPSAGESLVSDRLERSRLARHRWFGYTRAHAVIMFRARVAFLGGGCSPMVLRMQGRGA